MAQGDVEEALETLRRAMLGRAGSEGVPVPRLSVEEFRRRMQTELGLGAATINETVKKLRRATERHDGPRVVLSGSLADLKASWKAHEEDLILKRASAAVIRHRREAVARYCKCAGIDWQPARSLYEARSAAAREQRAQNVELPPDFVQLAASIVNDVQYAADPSVNAMYQHAARLSFFTAPRFPSEAARLKVSDVFPERGRLIYRQSKVGGPEGDTVLIAREVFGLAPTVLTHPKRKSYQSWLGKWRPKLVAGWQYRSGGAEDHGHVWVGPDGGPVNAEKFRQEMGAAAKAAWPGFNPYMFRSVGLVMRALEIVQERGVLDLFEFKEWSSHVKVDNLLGYVRVAKRILREARPGPELDAVLGEWRNM